MVEVFRRENESAGNMIRRFTRRVQQSGLLLRARRIRFFTPPLSRREKKERALRRIELAREKERLIKLGKLDEESWPPER